MTSTTAPLPLLPSWGMWWGVLSVFLGLVALWTPIQDCDETFNFWEPLHYALYGRGWQTWEYAPEFALRSYAFTSLYAAFPLLSGTLLDRNKAEVFVTSRMLIGVAGSGCVAWFLGGLRERFGKRAAWLCFFLVLSSPGMALQGVAFLPSTFSMYAVLLSFGAWLRGQREISIGIGAVGVLLGWPFTGLLFVPMGLHLFYSCFFPTTPTPTHSSSLHPFLSLLLAAIMASLVTLGASLAVDVYFYGKVVIPIWNIVKYNVIDQNHGGSELYGVEPWHFYLRNLLLNVTPFPLALFLLSPLLLFLPTLLLPIKLRPSPLPSSYALILSASAFLWLTFMSLQPHKEERFMTPAYPLLLATASIALQTIEQTLSALEFHLCPPSSSSSTSSTSSSSSSSSPTSPPPRSSCTPYHTLSALLLFLSLLLSTSRLLSLHHNYHGSHLAWTALHRATYSPTTPPPPTPTSSSSSSSSSSAGGFWSGGEAFGARVCVGKEWYRFPSSFLLPERTKANLAGVSVDPHATPGGPLQLRFLHSNFGGELPQPYSKAHGGAKSAVGKFNDANEREDERRFVPLEACDFVVDFAIPGEEYFAGNGEGGEGGGGGEKVVEQVTSLPRAADGSVIFSKPLQFDANLHFTQLTNSSHLLAHYPNGSSKGWSWQEAVKLHPKSSSPTTTTTTTTPPTPSFPHFRSVWRVPFLHAELSHPLTRAFRVPYVLDQRNVFGTYHILQRTPESAQKLRQMWKDAERNNA